MRVDVAAADPGLELDHAAGVVLLHDDVVERMTGLRSMARLLEARARGGGFGGEIVPDLTIFLDVPPDATIRDLGERMEKFFRKR